MEFKQTVTVINCIADKLDATDRHCGAIDMAFLF